MSTDSKESQPKTVRSRLVIKVAVFAAAALIVAWAVLTLTKGPNVPFDLLADSRLITFREDILDTKGGPRSYLNQRVYEIHKSRQSVADALAKEANARGWRKLKLSLKHEDYLSSEYRIHVVPQSESGPIHVHIFDHRTATFIDNVRERLGLFRGKRFSQ